MDAFLKIYLPIFLVGFILLVFVVPSIRVYRQTGINPFRFATKHDEAHDYIGASMKVFILFLLVAVVLFSFSDAAYQYLVPRISNNSVSYNFALRVIKLIVLLFSCSSHTSRRAAFAKILLPDAW